MKDVADKVAFITGGANGIGLAMAQAFSAAGMKVAIADIDDDALASAASTFAQSSPGVITVKTDVTDRSSLAEAREKTLAAFGKVHVLCNNAGVILHENFDKMPLEEWEWVRNVNLEGVINGSRTFIDDIKQHGEGGHVINTSSMFGQFGAPGFTAYCASKFAVVGLSEAMRHELAVDDIGVSVLCPGGVDTGLINRSKQHRPGAATNSASVLDDIKNSGTEFMEAAVFGDIALHAIRENIFYILTHREFEAPIRNRSQEIHEAFEYWGQFIDKRSAD